MKKLLRTPEERFENLADFPYKPNYVEINGARIHYIDEGQGEVVLCLHGEPTWSYLYRKFIPTLSANHRIICPDFIGFGRSDKYADMADYTFHMHFDVLEQFVERLGLRNITVVVQDWGGLLGLSLLGKHPDWFARVVIMNTFLPTGKRKMPIPFRLWRAFAKYFPSMPVGGLIKFTSAQPMSKASKAAYDAPFPDPSYKAGVKTFPLLVPSSPDSPGVKEMIQARAALKQWQKPALVMFSDKDPIMRGGHKLFMGTIPSPTLQPFIEIKGAGHFLQEDKGEEIANHIDAFMAKCPI